MTRPSPSELPVLHPPAPITVALNGPAVVTLNTAPAAVRLGIDVLTTEGVTFLSVTGDVDLATADQLQTAGEQALNALTGTLRINLTEVTFMDSTGLAALVVINNKAQAEHAVLVLEQPGAQVRRILHLSGLDQVFSIT
jgi:anti-sigma B factor antagonist